MIILWSNWLLLTRFESCRIRVDSCWAHVDSCWLVPESCWLVLIRVESCRTRVDSCWLVLIRVDLCWYSCIRIDLILSLCSDTLTLESIFEYIRQKLKKNMLILKFHPGIKCLHIFFSFFHPEMKFYSCLFDSDEFIPGWNFISVKTCKQVETFHHRQGWFRPGTKLISSRDETDPEMKFHV